MPSHSALISTATETRNSPVILIISPPHGRVNQMKIPDLLST